MHNVRSPPFVNYTKILNKTELLVLANIFTINDCAYIKRYTLIICNSLGACIIQKVLTHYSHKRIHNIYYTLSLFLHFILPVQWLKLGISQFN